MASWNGTILKASRSTLITRVLGLALLIFCGGIIHTTVRDAQGGVPFGIIAIFSVGAALSLGVLLWQTRVVVDTATKEINVWHGPLFKVYGWIVQWEYIEYVESRPHIIHTKGGPHTVYRIYLGGKQEVMLEQYLTAVSARKAARQTARRLRLACQDSTGSVVVTNEAQQVDETLRERARRLDEKITPPPRPIATKVEETNNSTGVSFQLPSFGISPGGWVVVVVDGAFALLLLSFCVSLAQRGTEMVDYLFAGGLLLVGLVIGTTPVLLWLFRSFCRTTLTLDRQELCITRTWFVSKVRKLPVDRIETLDSGGLDGPITISADAIMFEIDAPLTRKERVWIAGTLHAKVI